MSAPTLPGVTVTKPAPPQTTLNAAVAKPPLGHKHKWQKTERMADGRLFKLHVCLGHNKPIINAYDMTVLSDGEMAVIHGGRS